MIDLLSFFSFNHINKIYEKSCVKLLSFWTEQKIIYLYEKILLAINNSELKYFILC